MSTISRLVAAQLSQSSYLGTTPTLPDGWTLYEQVTDASSAFSVFLNDSTQQAVIAFRGSANAENFRSDFNGTGATAWDDIVDDANKALANLTAQYPDYQVFTDGHSLGGGMAQTFALENNLSGFGQNALPMPQTVINNLEGGFAARVEDWAADGNTFSETNVSGDPATLTYSTVGHGQYLSTDTTTLPSPCLLLDIAAAGLVGVGAAPAGAALLLYSLDLGHSINTVVNGLESSDPASTDTTGATPTATVDDRAPSLGGASVQVLSNGSAEATTASGQTLEIQPGASSATLDKFWISEAGQATQTADAIVAGAGGTYNSSTLGAAEILDLSCNANTIDLTSGGVSVLASGDTIAAFAGGENVMGQNDSISFSNGVTGKNTIDGDGDSINAGSSNRVTVDGAGDSIQSSSSDTISLTGADGGTNYVSGTGTVQLDSSSGTTVLAGNSFWVNGQPGDSVIVATGTGDNFTGNDDTLSLDDHGSFTESGTGDTINTGAGDSISASNDTIDVGANETSGGSAGVTSVGGYDDTINAGTGNTMNLYGGGNTISGSDDTIRLQAEDVTNTITGNDDSIDTGEYDDVTISGTGDSITVESHDTISLTGTPGGTNYVNGGGATIRLGASSGTTEFTGDGYSVDGQPGDSIVVASGTGDCFYGNGDTLSLDDGGAFSVYGKGDTIDSGTGDSIDVDSGTINIGTSATSAGSTGTTRISGLYDTINAGTGNTVDVSGIKDSISGSGDTIALQSEDTTNTITGNDCTINTGIYNDVTIQGTDETISSTTSDTIALTDSDGGTNHVSGGGTIKLGGVPGTTDLTGNNFAVYGQAGDSINVASGTQDYFYGSGFTLGLDDHGTFTDSGAGNTINTGVGDSINASGDTIDVGANDAGAGPSGVTQIGGTGNTINAGTGNTLNLFGGNDTVNGSGDTINFQSSGSSGVNTFTGDDDSIQLGRLPGKTLIQGDDNTIAAGPGDNLTLSGNGDSIAASNATINLDGGMKSVTLSGTGDVIDASNDRVTLSGSNETDTVYGGGDAFDATGSNDRVIDDFGSGGSVIDSWNSGVESSTDYTGWGGSGSVDGHSSEAGGYTYYSGYDRAAQRASGGSARIDQIGSWDVAQAAGNAIVMSGASFDTTLDSASASASTLASATSPSSTPVVRTEGATWKKPIITWNLGGDDSTSTGLIAQAGQSSIDKAFDEWATASGLQFEQVSGSQAADITISSADLDSDQTGVVGKTTLKSAGGALVSGVQVQLENPDKDGGLAINANGQLVYGSTGITLEQVALHEIGRALGLGANSDATSVMDFYSTSANTSLSAGDIADIRQLYPDTTAPAPLASSSSSYMAATVNSLIQRMAFFTDDDSGAIGATFDPHQRSENDLLVSLASSSLQPNERHVGLH